MIKTIIFDLGNVIIPFDIEIGLANLANACDLTSLEVREKLVREGHSEAYHEGRTSDRELFANVRRSLSLRMNFAEFAAAWNSIFLPEPLISEEFIRRLADKHRLLILSDTNRLHFDFVKAKYPILRHFDDFVLSHEVGAVKPSPKMYRAAVKKSECRPEECFFTDDKAENIEGARKFGITAVQFVSEKQLDDYLYPER